MWNHRQIICNAAFPYDGWNLIAEVNAQTGDLIRTYVWGLDLSGTMQGAGGIGGLLWINVEGGSNAGRYFVAYDGNGNVMGLVSADDGSVVAQYEYGPFAEPLRATGPAAAENPLRFSTKYTDPETGLLYYGYRYYSPSLGRWLSRDPVGRINFENEYSFIRNTSTWRFDAKGLVAGEVAKILGECVVEVGIERLLKKLVDLNGCGSVATGPAYEFWMIGMVERKVTSHCELAVLYHQPSIWNDYIDNRSGLVNCILKKLAASGIGYLAERRIEASEEWIQKLVGLLTESGAEGGISFVLRRISKESSKLYSAVFCSEGKLHFQWLLVWTFDVDGKEYKIIDPESLGTPS